MGNLWKHEDACGSGRHGDPATSSLAQRRCVRCGRCVSSRVIPAGMLNGIPPVDLPGPGDGRGVGLDQDVDGGQVAHWSVSFP